MSNSSPSVPLLPPVVRRWMRNAAVAGFLAGVAAGLAAVSFP